MLGEPDRRELVFGSATLLLLTCRQDSGEADAASIRSLRP
jgi:hypothetical protein